MTDVARSLAGILAGALLFCAPARAQTPAAISVQADGELPGFRIEEASSYLAGRMDEAGLREWRFVPRDPAAAAPNRIEWNFQILPYAGGQVRQFFPCRGCNGRWARTSWFRPRPNCISADNIRP